MPSPNTLQMPRKFKNKAEAEFQVLSVRCMIERYVE